VEISLPFGQRQLKINLDNETEQVVFLEPNRPPHDLVRLALAAPIGSPQLHELVRSGQSVAIVTSDITRPCPTHLMLPSLLEELAKGGVRDEDIQVIFALGSHRPLTEEEQNKILGPTMAQRLNCTDSDPGQ